MDIDDLYDLLIESLIYTYINTNTNTNILNNSLYDTSPIKYVITDEVKSNLIPIQFKDAKNKEQNISCAVTCDEFSDEDMIIQLPCNHCFNSDAILHWLTEESCECPVCRYKLESKEKRMTPINPLNESQYINDPQYINQIIPILIHTYNNTLLLL